MPQETGDRDQLHRALVLLYLAASLAYSLWALWSILPEHKRTAARMRLLKSSARVTSGLARRTGERSMGLELATGTEAYELPLVLGLATDWLMAAYDRTRGAL